MNQTNQKNQPQPASRLPDSYQPVPEAVGEDRVTILQSHDFSRGKEDPLASLRKAVKIRD